MDLITLLLIAGVVVVFLIVLTYDRRHAEPRVEILSPEPRDLVPSPAVQLPAKADALMTNPILDAVVQRTMNTIGEAITSFDKPLITRWASSLLGGIRTRIGTKEMEELTSHLVALITLVRTAQEVQDLQETFRQQTKALLILKLQQDAEYAEAMANKLAAESQEYVDAVRSEMISSKQFAAANFEAMTEILRNTNVNSGRTPEGPGQKGTEGNRQEVSPGNRPSDAGRFRRQRTQETD